MLWKHHKKYKWDKEECIAYAESLEEEEMTELSQFLNLVSRLSEQTLITVMNFKIVSNHCGTFNKRNLSYVTVIMFRNLIAN